MKNDDKTKLSAGQKLTSGQITTAAKWLGALVNSAPVGERMAGLAIMGATGVAGFLFYLDPGNVGAACLTALGIVANTVLIIDRRHGGKGDK